MAISYVIAFIAVSVFVICVIAAVCFTIRDIIRTFKHARAVKDKQIYRAGYLDGLSTASEKHEKIQAAYISLLNGNIDEATGCLGEVLDE